MFLHWSWFFIFLYAIQFRGEQYHSFVWNALECLTLFAIVLTHEFGHALACKQVGGTANQIVLWPLGGVAYVSPPQRPGAMLWSIAAGPLVNVALVPILSGLMFFAKQADGLLAAPDLYFFIRTIWQINLGLLIFNLLPVYPLDGGQILRSLLWFPFGRAWSLMIAASLGFVGVAMLIGMAIFWLKSVWLGIVAGFILLNCWSAWMHARVLLRIAQAPRRHGFACPACRTAPPTGAFWGCGRCRKTFDTFATQAICPNCQAMFETAFCIECGKMSPLAGWLIPPPLPPRL